MRILINKNIYGWNMTGLLGADAKWFFGFSRLITKYVNSDEINKKI